MKRLLTTTAAVLLSVLMLSAQDFKINESGYFNYKGVDAMSFNDYYPEGHQGGVAMIMHGKRVVTNGDIRFDSTPGQWQPVPVKLRSEVKDGAIVTYLAYPDTSRHNTGFNPMVYPDVQLTYSVTLAAKGHGFEVTVDLDSPIPPEFIGKAGFNLEFFPGELFGKPWIMDDQTGIFPQQPNGPVDVQESYTEHAWPYKHPGRPEFDFDQINSGSDFSPYTADTIEGTPYAIGHVFTCRPDDPYSRLTIKSDVPLKLYDGRMNHNNGWVVLRSEIPAGATKGAIKWYIEPNVVADWMYKPVVQVSQVGYTPNQPKIAVIETDSRDNGSGNVKVVKITPNGDKVVATVPAIAWNGKFLRYNYLRADFSDVKEPGVYKLVYGESTSTMFRIDENVYDRGVWQPVLEYFLPVQMCHMRVAEKYRVWHDRCHMDDGELAVEGNYIDGYTQEPNIPASIKPGETAHNINVGGWHDAGDFDLRIESQIGESYILAMANEFFKPQIDVTAIDQVNHNVEIHQPDGKNDLLQQIENGALTVVNGYLALGRVYRGIITHTARQYVLLGDAAAMTDGVIGNADDRWVFVENNPGRDISTAQQLAGTARSLRGFNDTLAVHCIKIAEELFANTDFPVRETPRGIVGGPAQKIPAAVELYLTTGNAKYFDFIVANWDSVVKNVARDGWCTARIAKQLEGNKKYKKQVAAYRAALASYKANLDQQSLENPYGVPYHPDIWGAGWTIQEAAYNYYFLLDAYPEIFNPDPVYNATHFILGRHPGVNQDSFACGIGTETTTIGYGLNRADWSYIPGGVSSGTALIRPDFPELLDWPFLWQQKEYVLGGGSSHYMFLVLATQHLLKK